MLIETRVQNNGLGKFEGAVNVTKPPRPRIKRITNEWIATFIMFSFSLSILIAKIYINYELLDKRLYYSKQDNLSDKDISCLSDWSNLTGIPDLSESIVKQVTMTSRQFMNTANQYVKASADTVVEVSTNYRWLINALLSGLLMTGFGWFIIYMDSCIPGVDPPITFRLFKRRGYRKKWQLFLRLCWQHMVFTYNIIPSIYGALGKGTYKVTKLTRYYSTEMKVGR